MLLILFSLIKLHSEFTGMGSEKSPGLSAISEVV